MILVFVSAFFIAGLIFLFSIAPNEYFIENDGEEIFFVDWGRVELDKTQSGNFLIIYGKDDEYITTKQIEEKELELIEKLISENNFEIIEVIEKRENKKISKYLMIRKSQIIE